MKSIIFSDDLAKITYYHFVFLASYYRWQASSSRPAFGNRSPLTGLQYNAVSCHIHDEPMRAGYKAIAKVYLMQAAHLRNTILK